MGVSNKTIRVALANYVVDGHFKGKFTSLAQLQAAHPTASAGDYAEVDTGPGSNVQLYLWDSDDGWVQGGGGGSFTLTDGNGTTANGTAVDLGGAMSDDVFINVGTKRLDIGDQDTFSLFADGTEEQVGIGSDSRVLSFFSNAKGGKGILNGGTIELDADYSPFSDREIPDYAAVKAYANSVVVGLLDDRGNYDASSNAFPSTGGSGTLGAILKGDLWTISGAGTLSGVSVTIGDVLRSLSNTPGQTASNWVITENNLGYVPENNANKSGTITASAILFPNHSAVIAYVATYVTANAVPLTRTLNGQDLTSNRIIHGLPIPYRTGLFYSNNIASETSVTLALVANTLRSITWRVSIPFTFDRISLNVGTGVGATTARMAIYADDGAGYPGSLVANSDTGTFDTATNGAKTNTPAANITLQPGIYHIAFNSNGAPTISAHQRYILEHMFGYSAAGAAFSNVWSVAFTYAAMPSPFPVGATLINQTSFYAGYFRSI